MVRLMTLLIVENILVIDAIFNPFSIKWSRKAEASDVGIHLLVCHLKD